MKWEDWKHFKRESGNRVRQRDRFQEKQKETKGRLRGGFSPRESPEQGVFVRSQTLVPSPIDIIEPIRIKTDPN